MIQKSAIYGTRPDNSLPKYYLWRILSKDAADPGKAFEAGEGISRRTIF